MHGSLPMRVMVPYQHEQGDFLSEGGLARTVSAVDAEAVGGAEILLLQRSASASRAALAAQSVRAVHWSCHRAVRKSLSRRAVRVYLNESCQTSTLFLKRPKR